MVWFGEVILWCCLEKAYGVVWRGHVMVLFGGGIWCGLEKSCYGVVWKRHMVLFGGGIIMVWFGEVMLWCCLEEA